MFLSYESLVIFAMKAYDNPSCKTIKEFEDDLSKFTYLVRLSKRTVSEDNTHIMLNLVMTLLNLFEQEACINIMFFKINRNEWSKIKTILTYMNRMPESIPSLQLIDSDIPICNEMIKTLREI